MRRATLGIIGGMGVQATGCFYDMLTRLQTIRTEQEYLDVILYSKSSTPDRTAFITGQSDESPLESLIFAARTLEAAGAACIAIPCVTSHFFYEELTKAVGIPILNMPEETAGFVAGRGYKKVGLLATDGTLTGRFFHKAFEESGIETIVPMDSAQACLMDIIYNVKRGESVEPEALDDVAAGLRRSGAQTVVLGCTELSLFSKDRPDYVDAMEMLARASLRVCL